MANNEIERVRYITYQDLIGMFLILSFIHFFVMYMKKDVYILTSLLVLLLVQIIILIAIRKYKDSSKLENRQAVAFHSGKIFLIESLKWSLLSAHMIGATLKEKIVAFGVLIILMSVALICLTMYGRNKDKKGCRSSSQNPTRKSLKLIKPLTVILLGVLYIWGGFKKYIVITFILCAFVFLIPFAGRKKIYTKPDDNSMLDTK